MNLKSILLPLLFISTLVSGQDLTMKMATLFKNEKALLFKSGEVSTTNGKYSSGKLPDALFGTYWVSSISAPIRSLFFYVDTTEEKRTDLNSRSLLENNLGKKVRLYIKSSEPMAPVEGVLEKMLGYESAGSVLISAGKKWTIITESLIERVEFLEKPNYSIRSKMYRKQLDVKFLSSKSTQNLSLSYLTNEIGWTPVYRLELLDKENGKLYLRAELKNDGEDLDVPALRLAATVPEFVQTEREDPLLDFTNAEAAFAIEVSQYGQYGQYNQYGQAYGLGKGFQSTKIEDYFFYTIQPGKLPRGSRLQFPVFEQAISIRHFYECNIEQQETAGSDSRKEFHPVYHYVEFKNGTDFPWTDGTVSILSKAKYKVVNNLDSTEIRLRFLEQSLAKFGGDLQPLSQEELPYTSPSEMCKIPVSQSPDIEVKHQEGRVAQPASSKKFFNKNYSLVKKEGRVSVINRGVETISLQIYRNVEGKPLQSDVKWEVTQEISTLKVNPSQKLSWQIELKPGERKEWTYTYETYSSSGLD